MHIKLLDFKAYDDVTYNESQRLYEYVIQIFGLDEHRCTYSFTILNFKPYFYVKVPRTWGEHEKHKFVEFLNKRMYCVVARWESVSYKKLYGFDNGTYYSFLQLYFDSQRAFNCAKNLWYNKERMLRPNGLVYGSTHVELYESNIPPLLRFFHEQNISPSGWVGIGDEKCVSTNTKKTTCTYEYETVYTNIYPKEDDTRVPYKICSFDIEASSSHGDFPLPVKSYQKLANEIIDHIEPDTFNQGVFVDYIRQAFGYGQKKYNYISMVYPKVPTSIKALDTCIQKVLNSSLGKVAPVVNIVNMMANSFKTDDDDDDDVCGNAKRNSVNKRSEYKTIIEHLQKFSGTKDEKLNVLNNLLSVHLPDLEGDKVTFIGSTFINYGEDKIYKNNCIVLNECSKSMDIENLEISCCSTESELLLEWSKLIREEDPDIIIGYNIFGFDYEFMLHRAQENGCVEDFLKTSRIKNEICGTKDNDTGKYSIHETSIVLASGPHNLNYINMPGRLQVDLYNFFRRDYNLASYKLDSVAGHFIGDVINKLEVIGNNTTLYSNNLSGLSVNAYIHLEEISHAPEYIQNGAKFMVSHIDLVTKSIQINQAIHIDSDRTIRWCLAKDDVTPQDIFRLTNGDGADRGVVAKYCIQDCNLVHALFKKIDVLTGFIEMSKLCSVPISFLVLRGQGIKLTSFISKKCREKNTLMPVLQSSYGDDEGYEGAIVLDPKCNLYLDNPVACVDYGSLYPSSMISENLCHSSKVWTKEYDLEGNMINHSGIENKDGIFIYDNLDNHTYVDVEYDTYTYVRKSTKSAAQKVKTGTKKCRFAESCDGKAIIPSVLEELLESRKATKKQMKSESNVFMKNILDKRQLSIKLTANSLYGQCGAKTSAFYEKDVAACTTATGRKLLIYAKKMIEGVYGDRVCDTTMGAVKTNAEYIYGDTDSVFFTFNLKHVTTGERIKGKDALKLTIELAQEAGALATKFLKMPHDLEYEKTFMPFCLLSKKRYVGMLYEFDLNKAKCKSMGIVLKRRDNAPIVKEIYGGIIDILMHEKDISKSLLFLTDSLASILNGTCSFDKFIITKSLRSGYKNPSQIAHKVLADRMGQRDSGNKPCPGDRIPFAYVVTNTKSKLQGDRIEHPSYIKEKRLKIDYGYYITNQIMKPVLQIFALVLFDLPCMKNFLCLRTRIKNELKQIPTSLSVDAYSKKEEQIKTKYAKQLIFDEHIQNSSNRKNNVIPVTNYFR